MHELIIGKLHHIYYVQQLIFIFLHTGARKKYSMINKHQRSVLEAAFTVQFFPNKTSLEQLALQTGLNAIKVAKWFAFRRLKTRQGKGDELYLIVRMYVHKRKNMTVCIFLPDHVLI